MHPQRESNETDRSHQGSPNEEQCLGLTVAKSPLHTHRPRNRANLNERYRLITSTNGPVPLYNHFYGQVRFLHCCHDSTPQSGKQDHCVWRPLFVLASAPSTSCLLKAPAIILGPLLRSPYLRYGSV